METIRPYVPPHVLTGTSWYEISEDKDTDLCWRFEADGVRIHRDQQDYLSGTWVVFGREVTVTLQESGRAIVYSGEYAEAIGRPHAVMRLAARGSNPRVVELEYLGGDAYREAGAFSREWQHYWDQLVPEEGEPDTVQGEVLWAALHLSAMYGNSGGGNWMERPDYFEGLADRVIAVLCDGTLNEADAKFVRRVVTELRLFCRDVDQPSGGPDCADMDRLPDLALQWCKRHPVPYRVHS